MKTLILAATLAALPLSVLAQAGSDITVTDAYVRSANPRSGAAFMTIANAGAPAEERLARWLLMYHDRQDGDDLSVTHEFLSIMLGVRRPTVTVAIHTLEGAGLIRARRGRIRVLSRTRLEEAAGQTYGPAEAEYERLIGPLRRPQSTLA